jgi:hypothetical protein
VTGGSGGFVVGGGSEEASWRVPVSVVPASTGSETGVDVVVGSAGGAGSGWGSGCATGGGTACGGSGGGSGFGLGFGFGVGLAAGRGVVDGLLLCSVGVGTTLRAASEPAAGVGCVTGTVREISCEPPVELVEAWVDGGVETTAGARAWAAVAWRAGRPPAVVGRAAASGGRVAGSVLGAWAAGCVAGFGDPAAGAAGLGSLTATESDGVVDVGGRTVR